MKLEIKQPEQPTEPVGKLYLEQNCGDEIILYCEDGHGRRSLAYFDMDGKTFHVFKADLKIIGYKLISN